MITSWLHKKRRNFKSVTEQLTYSNKANKLNRHQRTSSTMKLPIITVLMSTINAELFANPYLRRFNYFDYECESIIYIRGRRICRRKMPKPTIVKPPKRKQYVRLAPSYPAISNISSEIVRRMRLKHKMRMDGRYWSKHCTVYTLLSFVGVPFSNFCPSLKRSCTNPIIHYPILFVKFLFLVKMF